MLHPVRFALLPHSSYRAPIPNAPPIFALDAQIEEPTEDLPDPCRRDGHLAIQQFFLAKKNDCRPVPRNSLIVSGNRVCTNIRIRPQA